MSTSLAEALDAKYSESNDETPETDIESSTGFVIFAPKAGFHKCVPNTLIVTSNEISEVGDSERLSKFLSNATELDVSGNKLSDLNEIGTIFRNGPKLKFLNLSFNEMKNAEIPASLDFPTVESLRSLILIGTNVNLRVVWKMLGHTRNVEDLHLSLNNYKDVDLDACNCSRENETEKVTNFDNVKTVMFDDNPIASWEEISKLGVLFPNLRLLSLISCPIKNIPENAHSTFTTLKTLWMSNSQITELGDLENIKHFPALSDLRISGMPYLNDFGEEQRRQHIIALLPNIETLNRGRAISEDERDTAERNFIRYYKNKENPPARFQELSDKHGEVHELVNIKLKPPSKVNVVIRHEEKEIARMALNQKLTVKEVKELLEPVSGIPAKKMLLYYYDVEGQSQDIMKYPTKRLFSYNMQDNDELIIIVKV